VGDEPIERPRDVEASEAAAQLAAAMDRHEGGADDIEAAGRSRQANRVTPDARIERPARHCEQCQLFGHGQHFQLQSSMTKAQCANRTAKWP
jgi:hypothetical protein